MPQVQYVQQAAPPQDDCCCGMSCKKVTCIIVTIVVLVIAIGVVLLLVLPGMGRNNNNSSDSTFYEGMQGCQQGKTHCLPKGRLFASHKWVKVGDKGEFPDYGDVRKVIAVDAKHEGTLLVDMEERTWECKKGGVECVTFDALEPRAEGVPFDPYTDVQTQCFICFDEVVENADPNVDCVAAGKGDALTIDLEYKVANAADKGDANLLEFGTGKYWSVCQDTSNKVTLHVTNKPLPPLFRRTIDAAGEGWPVIDIAELDTMRASPMQTRSGTPMNSNLITFMGRREGTPWWRKKC